MGQIIETSGFTGKNTVFLARDMIGKTLVRARSDGRVTRHVVTETEAYHSEEDLACHASKGRTARTEVLYRPAGVWYVYLCYGIHEMLNLVVGPAGFPAAILFRGLHDVTGPGRLTKALNIDRTLNAKPAAPQSGLWLEDDDLTLPSKFVEITPRIGVDYAGPEWAGKPWRYVVSKAGIEWIRERLNGSVAAAPQ
jgi:DNA-3-methyladenine glycosylase